MNPDTDIEAPDARLALEAAKAIFEQIAKSLESERDLARAQAAAAQGLAAVVRGCIPLLRSTAETARNCRMVGTNSRILEVIGKLEHALASAPPPIAPTEGGGEGIGL